MRPQAPCFLDTTVRGCHTNRPKAARSRTPEPISATQRRVSSIFAGRVRLKVTISGCLTRGLLQVSTVDELNRRVFAGSTGLGPRRPPA